MIESNVRPRSMSYLLLRGRGQSEGKQGEEAASITREEGGRPARCKAAGRRRRKRSQRWTRSRIGGGGEETQLVDTARMAAEKTSTQIRRYFVILTRSYYIVMYVCHILHAVCKEAPYSRNF